MKRRIPHSCSTVGAWELRAVRDVVKRNYVGHGPVTEKLEALVSQTCGRKHAFAVSSGFHALGLAVRALDLPRGSRIALPILTCRSVLEAVAGTGHRPVLTDISAGDLTLEVAAMPKADAIIAPHAYGAPVDVAGLKRRGIPWIEDCATVPVAPAKARPSGASGTLAIFSFGATKYLTGGLGGMLVTDDDGLAARITDLLELGEVQKRGRWKNGFPGAWPGRLADLNAAVAAAQWKRAQSFVSKRRKIAAAYNRGLQGITALRLPPLRPDHSFYRYIVHTTGPSARVAKRLRDLGVDARTSVNHWLDEVGAEVAGGPWPGAEGWREHLLSLPIYPGLESQDVQRIIQTVIKVTA